MMKCNLKFITCFLAFCFLSIWQVNGQDDPWVNVNKVKFNHITWKDSAVHKVIAKMIKNEPDNRNVCVEECGYFVIYPPNPDINSVGHKKDSTPQYSYEINIFYYEIEQMLDNNPIGYFSVKGRPVIMFLGDDEPFRLHYSKKAIKTMSSLIEDHMPTKRDLKYKNEHDSTIVLEDFSEGLVRIHGGKIVNIYSDGRVEVYSAKY